MSEYSCLAPLPPSPGTQRRSAFWAFSLGVSQHQKPPGRKAKGRKGPREVWPLTPSKHFQHPPPDSGRGLPFLEDCEKVEKRFEWENPCQG